MASFSSPPRLPRRLRRRLSLVDCNKTPNTAEQIETKLRFANLRRQALETPVIAVLMDKDSGQYKGIRLASGQDLFSHQLVLDPTCTVTLAPTSSPPNFLREDLQVLSLKDDKGKVARGNMYYIQFLEARYIKLCASLCPEQDTSIRIIQIRGSLETSVCPKGVPECSSHTSYICLEILKELPQFKVKKQK